MSKQKETAAHMTTTESMTFQKSLKYAPGWHNIPRSTTCGVRSARVGVSIGVVGLQPTALGVQGGVGK